MTLNTRATDRSIGYPLVDASGAELPLLKLHGADATTRFASATSGVLLLRYLLGFRHAVLTTGALGNTPQRPEA